MPALIILNMQKIFPFAECISEAIAQEAEKEFYEEIAIITFSNTDNSNFDKELGFRDGGRYDMRTSLFPAIATIHRLEKRMVLGQHIGYAWNDNLHSLISDEVYVCGCETHASVYATALSLFHEKHVHVIKDLCISHTWMLHLHALYGMGSTLGARNIVMSSDIPDSMRDQVCQESLEKGEDADGVSKKE